MNLNEIVNNVNCQNETNNSMSLDKLFEAYKETAKIVKEANESLNMIMNMIEQLAKPIT